MAKHNLKEYVLEDLSTLYFYRTHAKAVELQAGWTTSLSFEGLKLLQVLNEYFTQSDKDPISSNEKDSINIYTEGQIAHTDQNSSAIFIHSDESAIPVFTVKKKGEDVGKSGIKSLQSSEADSLFRWVHIASMNLSCVCLGPYTKKKMTSVHAAYHNVFLPSAFSESVSGHTFLFLVDNLVFIGSVYIVAKSIVLPNIVNQSWKSEPDPGGCDTSENDTTSDLKLGIAACLEQTATSRKIGDPSIIVGRLVRHRFKFRKVKSTQKAGQVETQLEKSY